MTSPARVFTGHGLCNDIGVTTSIVEDFLQQLVNANCLGLDCIGFVGTYLTEAGAQPKYVGRRPLDCLAVLEPVQKINEIDALCVIVRAGGEHIRIIDKVTQRSDHSVACDIRQSSSGSPKTHRGVTITDPLSIRFLEVDAFCNARDKGLLKAQFAADNAKKGVATPDETSKTYMPAYESYRRSVYSKTSTDGRGYHNARLYQLASGAPSGNPVGGPVYIGKLRGGVSVGAAGPP